MIYERNMVYWREIRRYRDKNGEWVRILKVKYEGLKYHVPAVEVRKRRTNVLAKILSDLKNSRELKEMQGVEEFRLKCQGCEGWEEDCLMELHNFVDTLEKDIEKKYQAA